MLSFGFFILASLATLGQAQVNSPNSWNYAGEEYWNSTTLKECHGLRQSPININSSDVRNLYLYNLLRFSNYDQTLTGTYSNNGHTLKWTPTFAAGASKPTISCALLNGNFELIQFHFHWGSHEQQGSEHTIDGRAFPVEMHLVHQNTKYSSFDDAKAQPDGLAVIGIFFQVSYKTDDSIMPITTMLSTGVAAGLNQGATRNDMINPNKFIEEVGRNYYNYKGSLTTPSCNEAVSWIIMECTIPITAIDLAKFRKLNYRDDAPMVDNFRNVQWINNRIVNRVFN